MKVKALVAHTNNYGQSFEKKVGAVYEIKSERDAQVLVDLKIVEKHSSETRSSSGGSSS